MIKYRTMYLYEGRVTTNPKGVEMGTWWFKATTKEQKTSGWGYVRLTFIAVTK